MNPIFALTLFAGMAGQQTSTPEMLSIENSTFVAIDITEAQDNLHVEILPGPGDKLIVEKDLQGKVLLTVYRDGTVAAADQTKIDENAKRFWKSFAQAFQKEMQSACAAQLTQPQGEPK
jgi:hypothetical protein